MNSVVKNLNTNLDKVFNNKTFTTVVSLLLALYAGLAAPALPNNVILFFDTLVGKVLMVFLIGYLASKNTQMAIMLAVAFVVTLNLANNYKLLENFTEHIESEEEHNDNDDEPEAVPEADDQLDHDAPAGVNDSEMIISDDTNANVPGIQEAANVNEFTEKFSNCNKHNEEHEHFENQNIEPFVPSNNVFNSKDNLYAPY